MSVLLELGKAEALALLRMYRGTSADALEGALAEATSDEERRDMRLSFELHQAILAAIEGTVENDGDPLRAIDSAAGLLVFLLGSTMRVMHGGRACCPTCFARTAGEVLRQLAEASGRKAAIDFAMPGAPAGPLFRFTTH